MVFFFLFIFTRIGNSENDRNIVSIKDQDFDQCHPKGTQVPYIEFNIFENEYAQHLIENNPSSIYGAPYIQWDLGRYYTFDDDNKDVENLDGTKVFVLQSVIYDSM
jgi:hypothetical protein